MRNKLISKYYLLLAILGLILIWISLNIIARLNFNNIMLDMTDTQSYSLSPASQKQVKELPFPVYITVYYSNDISKENPVYGRYAEFVLQFLKQYQQQNPEKIFITIKDPKPFSDNEKEAQKAGLKPYLSADGRTNLYFGAVFTDSEGQTHSIDSFSPARNFWLEKDITTILNQFNREPRNIVGLISPIHRMIDYRYGKKAENYAFIDELSSRYNILSLAENISEIPLNVNVLMVVTPQKMSRNLLYALDQYILRGGKLIILIDKWIEQPQYRITTETINKMNLILKNIGLEMADGILGAQSYGKSIYISETNGGQIVPYPLWLDLSNQVLNHQNNIVSPLKSISMRSPVSIEETEHSDEIKITPLIEIKEGMLFPYDSRIFDKKYIINTWKNDDKSHVLATLSEGKYSSLFKHPPESAKKNNLPYLYYSSKPAKILLIGDSDFLRDDVWLDDEKLNDNGQMLLRAIEIFNEQPQAADLYRSQTRVSQNSLGEKLYNKIYTNHIGEITRLQYEIQELSEDYEHLKQDIQNNNTQMDASVSAHLTKLQDKIKQKQDRLKFLDYELKRNLSAQKQNIIFINLIAIPFVLIILMLLGYILLNRFHNHRIKEKYNEH